MAPKKFDSELNVDGSATTGMQLVSGADKRPQIASKTSDLQNDNRAVSLDKGGLVKDTVNLSVPKKPAAESLLSRPPSNSSMSGNRVYVRRKPELLKKNVCDPKGNDPNCPKPRQVSHEKQEITRGAAELQGQKASGFSASAPVLLASGSSASAPVLLASGSSASAPVLVDSVETLEGPSIPPLGKSTDASPLTDLTRRSVSSGVASSNSQKRGGQHFKERFRQLQTSLRNLERSSHEEYCEMLRSLSPAGRNAYAVELEKRAVRLSLEEDIELRRMKALNIFGNSSSKKNGSSSAKAPLGSQKKAPGRDQ